MRRSLVVATAVAPLGALAAGPISQCFTGTRIITLNGDANDSGAKYMGQPIPDDFSGLNWPGWISSSEGPQPAPPGFHTFALEQEPFAHMYINTTAHPTVKSITLQSFTFGCTDTGSNSADATPETALCGVTVSAINRADNLDSDAANQVKSATFESNNAGTPYTTVFPKIALTGTHFSFYLTHATPSTKLFLSDVSLSTLCAS